MSIDTTELDAASVTVKPASKAFVKATGKQPVKPTVKAKVEVPTSNGAFDLKLGGTIWEAWLIAFTTLFLNEKTAMRSGTRSSMLAAAFYGWESVAQGNALSRAVQAYRQSIRKGTPNAESGVIGKGVKGTLVSTANLSPTIGGIECQYLLMDQWMQDSTTLSHLRMRKAKDGKYRLTLLQGGSAREAKAKATVKAKAETPVKPSGKRERIVPHKRAVKAVSGVKVTRMPKSELARLQAEADIAASGAI